MKLTIKKLEKLIASRDVEALMQDPFVIIRSPQILNGPDAWLADVQDWVWEIYTSPEKSLRIDKELASGLKSVCGLVPILSGDDGAQIWSDEAESFRARWSGWFAREEAAAEREEDTGRKRKARPEGLIYNTRRQIAARG